MNAWPMYRIRFLDGPTINIVAGGIAPAISESIEIANEKEEPKNRLLGLDNLDGKTWRTTDVLEVKQYAEVWVSRYIELDGKGAVGDRNGEDGSALGEPVPED